MRELLITLFLLTIITIVVVGAVIGLKLINRSGVASWYDQGSLTASGAIYDQNGYTAASNKFKLGSVLHIRTVDGKRAVIVVVNDRMSKRWGQRRLVDLTPTAFKRLAQLKQGVVNVTVKEVSRCKECI